MADRLRFKEFVLERLPATRCKAKVVLSLTDDDIWMGEAEGLATQAGELRTAADACVVALTKAIAGHATLELLGVKSVRAFDNNVVIVSMAYTEDSEWRNRAEFITGRPAIRRFLERKWAKELDYRLKKKLWGFRENRMAVQFEYEWHDETGQWYRSYGNELWEFDDHGLMARRYASINDAPIREDERRVFPHRAGGGAT